MFIEQTVSHQWVVIVSSRNGTNLFGKCLCFFLPEVAGYDFFLYERIDPTPPSKLFEGFFSSPYFLCIDWRRCQLASGYWSVFALVFPGHLYSFLHWNFGSLVVPKNFHGHNATEALRQLATCEGMLHGLVRQVPIFDGQIEIMPWQSKDALKKGKILTGHVDIVYPWPSVTQVAPSLLSEGIAD